MIVLFAITGLVLLVTAFAFILRDFSRFIWAKTIKKRKTGGFIDYGEYTTTWFAVIVLSLSGFIFYKTGTALLSYFLADDLISFFRIMRGVFTIESDVQNPFVVNHVIAGLIGQPVLLFLSCWVILGSLRTFMHWINAAYSNTVYTEGDVLYFGFFSVLIFMTLEIFSYSQAIPIFSGVVHIVYLTVAKLSLICYFLVLSHSYLLASEKYRESLPQYIDFSPVMQKIVFNPVMSAGFTLGTGILLTLPLFIGAQFLENNWFVAVFALMSGLLFYKVMRHVVSRGYNYLGAIMFFDSDTLALKTPFQRTTLILGCTIPLLLLALLLNPKSLVFLLFLIIPLAILLATGLGISYLSGFAISLLISHRNERQMLNRPAVFNYLRNCSTGIARSLVPALAVALTGLVLFTLFPKKYKVHTEHGYVNRVVDASQTTLMIGTSDGNICIPASRDELPDFMIKCLFLQEDRDFFQQNSWLPQWSNWHGVSIASLYRMISGTGGGSNINMQLIKNEAFPGSFPRDFQRKYSEMLAAYQLSMQLTPSEIITRYVNKVGMIGGTGHQGAVMAAHSAFHRPLGELNKLEQLYLVASLKRGMTFKTRDGQISYRMAPEYSLEIKESLLFIADAWREQGLLEPGELAELKNQHLRFGFDNPMAGIPVSTREFLKGQMPSANAGGYTFATTLNHDNQQRIRSAINRFNNYFRNQRVIDAYELTAAALVIDIQTGNIVGHYGGEGISDLTTFAGGNPMGSVIKPFILLELLESGKAASDIKLYDGKISGKLTPNNYSRRYSNEGKGIYEIISKSLNAPMVNIREITDPMAHYADVEKRFSAMNIRQDQFLKPDNPERASEIIINYPLGSRNMTLFDIAQAYQVLLNDGKFMQLRAFTEVYDPFNLERKTTSQKSLQLYSQENARTIKEAMHHTMLAGGTGTHIVHLLPDSQRFYAKTGTSDKAIHGYTVLSNGTILIVSYATYATVVNDRLELNETPPIPFESGVRSAGILAAFIFNEWDHGNHKQAQQKTRTILANNR